MLFHIFIYIVFEIRKYTICNFANDNTLYYRNSDLQTANEILTYDMTDVRKIYCSGITGITHMQQTHCKIMQNIQSVIQTPCTLSNKKILKKRPSLVKDFYWFSISLCTSNLKLYKKLYISNAEKSPKTRESFTSQMNPAKTCLTFFGYWNF